jgi:hypothetical protein
MRILQLACENIQRLSAVQIKPDGSSVVILAGDNEQGKSSCLDAIEMALGGEKTIPPKPVRSGAAKGKVVVDLGDMIVTRTFTQGGGGSLTVTNRDGAKYPSAQSLLDGLYSKLTFDPLAFSSAKPPDQSATLRALARIRTDDLEEDRKVAFDERTIVNRDVARLKGAIEKAPTHADAGTKAETFEALSKALADADTLAEASAKAELALSAARSARIAAERRVGLAAKALLDAQAALDAAEVESEEAGMAVAMSKDDENAKASVVITAKKAVPDRAELRSQISTIEARNHKVLQNQARAELEASLRDQQAKADALTATITRCDTEKAERLTSAKFPVDGLGISDTGVTWQGLPFEQASTAVRTRVSVAIGAALHPKLKILLIRNGNDLDAKSLATLAEFSEQEGLQCWIERIAGGNGLQTIVIEDGAVREPVPA